MSLPLQLRISRDGPGRDSMLAAILTPFFFALSAVAGQRVAVRMGSLWGNFVRLLVATGVLGLVVLILFPDSMHQESFRWFFLSGVIGFGVGDVALYLAFERVGSRLTMLLNLCLAPLFAMALEWVWLENGVTVRVLICSFMVLIGVVMAIRPGAKSRQAIERRGSFALGLVAAVVAGCGQGTGAVVSRKAEAVALELGVLGSGISAAFQRVAAGLVFAALVVLLIRWLGSARHRENWKTPLDRSVAPWLLGAALFGPVIGVSCFQWALQSLESGIVLAVVATTPIVMIPLAMRTEGDHPSVLSIVGAFVAVAGVVLLNVWA
ncbi:MAG: DMT family transporter [Verrucomicrobiales bacterium]